MSSNTYFLHYVIHYTAKTLESIRYVIQILDLGLEIWFSVTRFNNMQFKSSTHKKL